MFEYLHDGVWVKWDGDILILSTHDGNRYDNFIYLEPETIVALKEFWDRSVENK